MIGVYLLGTFFIIILIIFLVDIYNILCNKHLKSSDFIDLIPNFIILMMILLLLSFAFYLRHLK